MMKKAIYIMALVGLGTTVSAQNKWSYDFGDATASFTSSSGSSSTKFLAKIPVNPDKSKIVSRVRIASDGSGEVNLVKSGASFIKGAGLEILAGTTTSKFAMYNIQSTPCSKISFNIKFDNSAAGQWIFANGNSSSDDDLFKGNSTMKETSTEIFSGFRCLLTEAQEINLAYRNGSKWSTIKGATLTKNTEYLIEVYSNNSAEEKSYTKEGNQIIKANTTHVWINGKKIFQDFPTAGLESEKALSAFIIYGYKPKDSDAKPYVWIDNLEFADKF